MISTKHYRTLLIGLSAGMLAAALPYMDARAGLPEQLTSNNFGIHQVGTSKVVMDRDGNHVEFQILRPFNGDFRVFGITFNQLPHSAIGYIDAFMPMVELALDKKVWQESAATDDKRCEAQTCINKCFFNKQFSLNSCQPTYLGGVIDDGTYDQCVQRVNAAYGECLIGCM